VDVLHLADRPVYQLARLLFGLGQDSALNLLGLRGE
jgi:hypothetical protein